MSMSLNFYKDYLSPLYSVCFVLLATCFLNNTVWRLSGEECAFEGGRRKSDWVGAKNKPTEPVIERETHAVSPAPDRSVTSFKADIPGLQASCNYITVKVCGCTRIFAKTGARTVQ